MEYMKCLGDYGECGGSMGKGVFALKAEIKMKDEGCVGMGMAMDGNGNGWEWERECEREREWKWGWEWNGNGDAWA